MKTQALNVYILNENFSIGNKLKYYITKKLGGICNINLFCEKEPFLRELNNDVNVVIIDDYQYDPVTHDGKRVYGVVESVKQKNAGAQIIVLSSDSDFEATVKIIEKGATEVIPNKFGAWNTLYTNISKIVNYPIIFISREFRVSKFVAIFTMVFLTMLVIVAMVMATR